MNSIRLRQFSRLEYGDPYGFLTELRKLENVVATSSTPERIKTLRTQALKTSREMRDAAIFCVGMSERMGVDIRFAPIEDQDFDFVATWLRDGEGRKYCPVQIKETVPENLNPNANINEVIDSLVKYGDSTELVVSIKLNRREYFDPKSVKIPAGLQIGGLWVFGSIAEDQSEFGLWGDFLSETDAPWGSRFSYPSRTSSNMRHDIISDDGRR